MAVLIPSPNVKNKCTALVYFSLPLRMLRRSLPQKGSILGNSSPSAVGQGLWSGDEGMGGTCSCGDLELLGGGEVEEGGGEDVIGVGV